MTATAAPAQEQPDDGSFPTDAEVSEGLEPTVLKESRIGDVATITLEIPAGADTFTTSGLPNNNWSADPNLRVGFNQTLGFGAERMFLFFSVSSIPSNATIQSADLRAFLNGFSPTGDAPMGLLARFLNSPWDASTLTWNNYNPSWGAEIGVGFIPATTGWVQASVTDPVAQWVSGVRANYGIMVMGDETPQQRERVFTALNANNGLHPRLIVTYNVIVDTTPPTSSVNALPQWSPAGFTVRWTGADNANGSGLKHFDIQVRANGGAWQNWLLATTATQATFNGNNGIFYEFRSRAVDIAGNVEAWPNTPDAGTTIDSVPPNASVNPLPLFTFTNSFPVTWGGTDTGSGPAGGSGIARFDVEYQLNGGPWMTFTSGTTTSGQVLNAVEGQVYGFRARAVDNVGNVQAFSPGPQTETTISLSNPEARITPFNPPIATQNSFIVQWTGTGAPGASIVSFDVQFSFNGGPWQPWLTNFGGTSQQFMAQAGDGVYAFRVRARDSANRLGDFVGGPASSIAVDTVAPNITIQVYQPAAFDN
jgi:hypothetical protein